MPDRRPGLAEPPELKRLNPEDVQLRDLQRFPHMTGWFAPGLLAKLLLRVIISDVFGQYADRRLIEAALDQASKEQQWKRADLTKDMMPDEEGAIWIDYVADLGDGFDATYAVAYLLAQPVLSVDGHELKRGSMLVMGGDEVYPTATRDDYIVKMRLPYGLALPDQGGERHLSLFLLPGNHDWHDGLVNFLALFCRGKPTPIGDWRTRQRRSYFAAKVSTNWWIWGIDIALVRDMDQPQADYFVAIAENMPEHTNIILCSAEPGWYKAEAQENSYHTLSYAARIAENAGKDLKIPLVLSGDSHHYARYSGPGTQYITSGGGGAFVDGTLELKDTIKAEWLREKNLRLALEACYPSKQKSIELLSGNLNFAVTNRGFALTLGILYWIYAFVLTSMWRVDVAIILYFTVFIGFFWYSRYQEARLSWRMVWFAAAHALAHMLAIVALSWVALWLVAWVLGGAEWHWFLWLTALAVLVVPVGSWLAGTIYGLNLLITCRYFGLNHRDAFSAMSLNGYRHFVRIRIVADTLTIYPIKLDEIPKRHQWRKNPRRDRDRSPSVFVADPAMMPHLIEKAPIVIQARHAPTTAEVKTPSELPPERS